MHPCLKFIYFGIILHVSDGLSVHHKEFRTVHTVTGICQTDTAVCQQTDISISLTYACCCMYSLELLVMDGKTVRNMQHYSKINKFETLVHLVGFCYRLTFSSFTSTLNRIYPNASSETVPLKKLQLKYLWSEVIFCGNRLSRS